MRPRAALGFTLLELMIVVVIVGLLAGMAIPSTLGLIQSRRFDSGVQAIATEARKARARALERSETVTFEFTLHDPALNKTPEDPPDRFTYYRGTERPPVVNWEPLPDRIWIWRTSVQGPPYRWTFDERGTVLPSQLGTIVLQDATNRDLKLDQATSLTEYLRSKKTNRDGRSRGVVMNTYLGKISVVTVGNL